MKHSTTVACNSVRCWRGYAMNAMAFLLTFALVFLSVTVMTAQTAFVRSTDNLWEFGDAQYHIDALDQLYGAGNWSDLRVETLNVTDLLDNHTFIYIDGGDAGANEVETFLNANLPAIEAWVSAGGNLLLNAAPNEGDGMSFGFGGVELLANNLFFDAEASDPAHPIFDGGLPTSWTGNYFGHALICPAGMSAIMNETGSPTDVCLAEMDFGSGKAVFGGLTLPFFGHDEWTEGSFDLLVNILDYTGGAVVACEPAIEITCPADVEVACGTDISPEMAGGFPAVDANECVAELDITFMDNVVSDDSCPLMIARTWVASDGETTEMCTQMITVFDDEAPIFTSFPEDISIECSEGQTVEEVLEFLDAEVPFPTAEDCSEFGFDTDYSIVTEGLDCPVVAECIKTITAIDVCGNSVSQTLTVTIFDYTGPVLSDFESEVMVSCIEEVPAPEMLTAFDECSDMDSEVEIFESNTGVLVESCDISTSFGAGDDWALWLPVLGEDGMTASANFHFDADGGKFDQYADGTARIYGTLVNDMDADQIFEMDLWLENKADWATWSGLGRSYKDDLGCAQPDLFESWMYWELVNGFSTITGAGDLAGDILYINHMPANYYFGFQMGQGATNKNCEFGLSGWFTYNGYVGGEAVEGHGDVNVDSSCQPILDPQECIHDDEITYFYRAVDACGNATMEAQVITVNDEIAPEFIDFPANVTVDCQDFPVEIPTVTAEDNCEGEVIVEYLGEETILGECPNAYQVEYSWAAFDICANRTDMTWTVTVIDDEAPQFEGLPEAEITVECDAVPAAPEVTVSDNCSAIENIEFSYEESTIAGDCPGNYTIIRTWSAMDECENENGFEQVINVQDTTAPTFNDYVFYTSLSCEEVDAYTLTASDNCGSATVEIIEEVLQSGGCMGVLYRVYEATDECGNTSTTEQYITITDTIAPELVNVPADETLECSDVSLLEDGNYFTSGDVFGTDNCALEVTIEYSEEVLEDGDDCDQSFIIVRTWIATDYCENENMASQTVTVLDTTAPVFVEFPANETVECSDELPEVVFPTAEDNCDELVSIELTEEEVPGTCEGEYTLNRIFRGFDDCGNEVMGVQVITIVDTTAPVFTSIPDGMIVECNTEIPASEATAEDACSTATVTYVDGPATEGQCPQEQFITRTFTAVDACGNESTATQSIQIVDTTAPIFDAYDVEVEAPCDNIVVAELTATDNCGMVSIEFTDTPVSGGCAGRIIRDYVAMDECGNSSTAQQIITLTDVVAPVFVEFPADMNVECDNIPAVAEGLFAEDNCDDEVEISYLGESIIDGDCPQNYTIVRSWSAIDHCDNETIYTQNINVSDNTAPVFTEVAADVTIECDETMPEPFAAADDNCGEVSISVEGVSTPGDCPQASTMVRTYTAMDECGNMSTATQTITIVDTTAPEFTFVPADLELECDEEVPAENATAEDNCGETTVTWVDYYDYTPWVAGSNGGNGIVDLSNLPNGFSINGSDAGEDEENDESDVYTFAMTAVKNVTLSFDWEFNTFDEDGASFDPFVYVINDGEPVNISDDFGSDNQSGAFSVALEAGSSFSMGIWSTDNALGLADVTVSNINFEINELECPITDCFIRQFTAVDECGNAATATQNIVIVDTTAPIFEAYEIEVEAPCDNVDVVALTATDNCSDVEITVTDSPVSGGCAGRIIRDYVATDACGNEATAQQIINLTDEVAPVFTEGPADLNVECDNVPAESAAPLASDNCDEEVEVSYLGEEIINGDCPQNYTIIRSWLAVDHCDNEATYTQTINVSDNTAPVFTEVAEDVTIECDEDMPAPFAMAEDNCGEVTINVEGVSTPGDCPQASTMVRTYTAMDECGNMSTATQTITIVDTTAPVFTSVPADLELECDMEVPVVNATAEDNCGETTVTWEDYYDYTPWMAGSTGGNGVVDLSDLPNGMSIIGSDNGLGDEEGEEGDFDPNYTFAMTAVKNVTLSFDWTYSTVDVDGPGLDPFVYVLNDGDLENISSNDGSDNQSGSFSIDLEAGASFSMGIFTTDNTLGLADVTVSNINFEINEFECPITDCFIRQFTAVDECGNAVTANQNIVKVDTTAPIFDAYEVEVEAPCDNIEVVALTATDNCSDVVITVTETPVSGGCAGRIIRDYVATDACGNEATAQQIITLIDEVAPVLVGVPADDTVECGLEEIPEVAEVSVEDNCDMEIEVMFSETENALDCGYEIVRTWSAMDHCDNEVSATQVITVVDTTAPMFEVEDEVLTVDCNAQILLITPEAFDACDEMVDVTSTFETTPGDCPNEWTEVTTYTATDDCGNEASVSVTVNYVDDSAPEFTFVPFSNEYSCDEELPTTEATAIDNCGDVTITSNDVINPGQCANQYDIVRTWTATDACGNQSTATTTYFIYDFTAPVFTTVLTDVNVECAGDVPAAPAVEATDNCSDVTITSDSDVDMDDCGNYVEVITYTATDACDNSSSISYTVTVNDMTAPELEGLPTQNLVLDCEDEIPAPAEVTALDNCEGIVDVDFNEELFGELPAEGSSADCVALTPEAVEDGEVCTGEAPWSLKLFNFNGFSSALYSTIEANWVEYPNGSATLTGTVVSLVDPNRGWIIDVEFENGMDWAEWSTQDFPTSYKDDCNASGDNHFDWTYYIMTAGATLTGWGSFDGAVLDIAHAPSNYYYGYQVGVAANNVNENYGGGGWFTYSGIFNEMEVNGSGDFAFDHDCCPQYGIERTWCAVDCSGNETCFTQTITFADLGINPPVAGGGAGEAQEDIAKGGSEDVTRISAYPNPAMNKAFVEFTLAETAVAHVEIFSLNGQKVADLYNANAEANELYRVEFNAAELPVGVYLYRLTTENEVITDRIIINK